MKWIQPTPDHIWDTRTMSWVGPEIKPGLREACVDLLGEMSCCGDGVYEINPAAVDKFEKAVRLAPKQSNPIK